MSALDRAFIKAFAKDASGDRSATRTATGTATTTATIAAKARAARDEQSRAADRPAVDRAAGVATIPIQRSPVGKPHFEAAMAAASVAAAARPMSDADRRAFERSFSSVGSDEIVEVVDDSPLHAPTEPNRSRSLADANQRIARLDAASKAAAPHFSLEQQAKAAAPAGKKATEAERETTTGLPAAVRLPSIPMPKSAVAELPQPIAPESSVTDENSFTPVWEVDRYIWPAVCDQLIDDWAPALSSVVESIRSLIDEFAQRDEEDRAAPIVAVASFGRGEGRTTASACLARSCATAGLRTCLIDGDFENPQLASVLGLNSLAGWEDVMLAKLPLEEAAVLSIEDRFTLMPALRARPAAELFGTRKTHRALASLAAQFDLIVIDLGPIVEDERGAFASVERCPFDAAVMVRDLRWTTDSQLEEATRDVEALGAPVLAIVENFADSKLPVPASPRVSRRGAPGLAENRRTAKPHLE